jgi:hypothetical protein
VSMHKLFTLEGEAMSLLEAIREASFRGWSKIIFESDRIIVADALQTNHMRVSKLSSIILCHLSLCYIVISILKLSSPSDKQTWWLTFY